MYFLEELIFKQINLELYLNFIWDPEILFVKYMVQSGFWWESSIKWAECTI